MFLVAHRVNDKLNLYIPCPVFMVHQVQFSSVKVDTSNNKILFRPALSNMEVGSHVWLFKFKCRLIKIKENKKSIAQSH